MKKEFLFISILSGLLLIGVSYSIISSYDSITGYAVVEKSISLDIIGSSNDDNYTLTDVHQGETKYSPKIKIKNEADVSIDINLNVSVLEGSAGDSDDVTLSIVDETKNVTLYNPITIPTDDLYVYVKHVFSPSASPGNYYFSLEARPVE